MCGKFTQLATWAEVVAFSAPIVSAAAAPDRVQTTTVMSFAHLLRLNAAGEREVVPARWGWADRRAKDPRRSKHMHARCETIDQLPTFREAFAHRRGIIPVRTFNEGEEVPASGGKTRTKQWVVAPTDGLALGVAVLYEDWAHVGADGVEEVFPTFVMITTPPNALIGRITDRMPAILPPESWATWLGQTGASLAEIKALLTTHDDGGTWTMAPQPLGPQQKGWTPKPPKAEDQPDLF